MRLKIFLLLFCMGALTRLELMAQLTYKQLYIDYDDAWTFKNLTLIPIRPKGLPGTQTLTTALKNVVSLEEAMKNGWITVMERGSASTENVHWLSVSNISDKPIYIKGGELLEGGRQDRMVSKDTVLMPGTGRIDLPVMCVEEGRWSEKTKKFTYKGMANTQLRKVLDVNKNQVLIWQYINKQLELDSLPSKTFSYLAFNNDKKWQQLQNEYLRFFKKKWIESDSNIVGFVAISGDKILGSDIYLTPALLMQSAETMMHGFAQQAIQKGAAPVVTNEAVKKYLDQFLENEHQQQVYLQKNGKQFFYKNKLIHITSY